MTLRNRVLVLVAAVAALAVVAVASILHASARAERRNETQPGGPKITAGRITLTTPGTMVFRNMAWGPHRDELTTVSTTNPAGPRTASGLKCLRFYAASGTGICLQAVHGTVTDTYRALILDAHLKETARYDVPGIPSRARVSPTGHFAAWTAFVGGDSYAGTNFSTRAAIVDTRTGKLTPTLESFRIIKGGHVYHSADVNFWGVTFASDDRTFYATLATKGSTYLVRGDLRTRTVTTVHTNVECPSLSPDGTHIVFKKRTSTSLASPWRLYVLDLKTLQETPLAETRSIDDQAAWLGDDEVMYQVPQTSGTGYDIWEVPADGTGTPKLLIRNGFSPAAVGGN